MENLFGTTDEVSFIRIGLILSTPTEGKVNKSLVVLVPNVIDRFLNTAM